MLPVLQIGPLSVPTSGLILLAGLWVGLSLSERFARRFKSDPEIISNLLFFSLLAAILGARLSYALRFPNAFIEHPASLISLNPGLLDPWGAAGAALLSALIYGQRKNLRFWPTLDAVTPAIASLILALALSNLASGMGYGMPSELPWSIELWGTSRHPTQIYEALAAFFILAYLLRRPAPNGKAAGSQFLDFAALSAASRLFLEAFRGDSPLLPNGWRLIQILAWLALAGSIWQLWRVQKRVPR